MADWLRKTRFSRLGSQRTVAEVSGCYVGRLMRHVRTVIGYGIDPLVESRVDLCDNMLFPLLPNKAEQCFTLVD